MQLLFTVYHWTSVTPLLQPLLCLLFLLSNSLSSLSRPLVLLRSLLQTIPQTLSHYCTVLSYPLPGVSAVSTYVWKWRGFRSYVPVVQPYGRFNDSFSWTAKKVYLNATKKNMCSSWASWAAWALYKWPANLAQYEIHWSKLTTFLILLGIRCWNWWRVFWQMWFAWFLNASQSTICVQIIQRHKSVLFIL